MLVLHDFKSNHGVCVPKPCQEEDEVLLIEDGQCHILGDAEPCTDPLTVRMNPQLGKQPRSTENTLVK